MKRESAFDLIRAVVTASTTERIPMAAFVSAFSERGFGLLLLAFALPNCIPAPPAVLSIFGVPVLLIGIQMLLKLEQPWLPKWVLTKSIPRAGLANGMTKAAKRIRWVEALFKPRLDVVFDIISERILGLFVLVFAISIIMPLPGTNFIPAIGCAVIGLALVERDGLACLIGLLIGCAGLVFTSFVLAALWGTIWLTLRGLFA
jgi:hypothetical protein